MDEQDLRTDWLPQSNGKKGVKALNLEPLLYYDLQCL